MTGTQPKSVSSIHPSIHPSILYGAFVGAKFTPTHKSHAVQISGDVGWTTSSFVFFHSLGTVPGPKLVEPDLSFHKVDLKKEGYEQ